MSERHPARRQILSYLMNSVVGTALVFTLLVLVTGVTLMAGFRAGGTAGVVYGVVANVVVAVVLVQHNYWDGGDGESDDSTGHVFGWLGDIAAAVFVIGWLNALVSLAVVIGIAAPGAWGYTAATGYVVLDLLTADRGVPLGVTATTGLVLWLGGRLTEFADDVSWRELAPTAIINRQFHRRPPELR